MTFWDVIMAVNDNSRKLKGSSMIGEISGSLGLRFVVHM